MSHRQVRAKGLAVLQEDLSGRDLAIIGQVADLRLMSGRQIAAVHFAESEHQTAAAATRACNRVLARLVRDRLLARLDRRVGGVRNGSSGFVYALGTVGHRCLALDGPRPRFREPGPTFALHTLAVAQLVVDCTLAARDKRFDVLSCQAEPRCWRQFTSMNGGVVVRPDLFLALGVGEYEHRFFVEVDRGTEHLPALINKSRLYESYYASGREQADHGVSPRTCWVVPDEPRALRLRQAIDRDRHLTNQLFVVTINSRALAVLAGGGS
jgi:hypothetical protein